MVHWSHRPDSGTKHVAYMDGTSITYSDRSCEGRKKAALSRSRHQAKKFGSDPDAMHGPLIVKVTSKTQPSQRGTQPTHL